jgi:hypothetical protein
MNQAKTTEPKPDAAAAVPVDATAGGAERAPETPASPKKRKKPAKKRGRAQVISLARADDDAAARAKYPRHPLAFVLRVPRGILDQNAGKGCSIEASARFAGMANNGEYRLVISSATKFGLLDRPSPGMLAPSDLSKKILRPKTPDEELEGLRQAVLKAPNISDVYKNYRGENLPDDQFFDNALVDTFGLPKEKLADFKKVLLDTLRTAKLVTEHEGKYRILDVSHGSGPLADSARIQQPAKGVAIAPGETCFVMMPFAQPIGGYYSTIYEPAIRKAGLTPIRADTEIFGTGKIIDQIWRSLNAAKVLVAELTGRNPNVFYELGLAHALSKPVVLVSSNEDDVPFDLHHIRVIYYDMKDPFWGQKLIDKIAENMVSAIKNPEEATFRKIVEAANP